MRGKAAAIASAEEREAALEWVDWAGGFAERLDPLNSETAAMPAQVEPKPEALEPFMGGLTPHVLRGW